MNRVPISTSSSGKASTARRNWAAMMALRTWSRLALRLTEASPHSRQGVPPMRSRVQNEKPQLSGVADLGDQDPRLGLLRQQTDVEASRAVGDDVGHLGQLGVRQGGAVLCFDSERHSALTLLTTFADQPV